MKASEALPFGVAAVAAGLVWAFSMSATGTSEPWDAEGGYYFGALLLAGVVSGFLAPKPLWGVYLGALLGQVAYQLIFLNIGPLVGVGFVFLLFYTLVFLAGAAASGALRGALR